MHANNRTTFLRSQKHSIAPLGDNMRQFSYTGLLAANCLIRFCVRSWQAQSQLACATRGRAVRLTTLRAAACSLEVGDRAADPGIEAARGGSVGACRSNAAYERAG